jgi:acyl-coenzyme A thioesterase PaaI-like protein
MTFRVEFVERTGLELLEGGRGQARYRMPLAGNENHVGVMYMGAFTVLAEATAAVPGISILDATRFYPIIKDIAVEFHKMAPSDVFAEFRLDEPALETLLADLERKGSATYLAEFPMHDAGGVHVASGKVTVKLLSHGWTRP